MIKITKITGKKQIIENLNRIRTNLEKSLPGSLRASAKRLGEHAVTNLEMSMGTGRWGVWPKHVGEDSIRNPKNWVTNIIDGKQIELSCNSSHAAVVELGGVGEIRGSPIWPIGKSQGYYYDPLSRGSMAGGKIFMRRGFAIQKGYGYLSKAMNNSTIQTEMRHIIRDNSKKHLVV